MSFSPVASHRPENKFAAISSPYVPAHTYTTSLKRYSFAKQYGSQLNSIVFWRLDTFLWLIKTLNPKPWKAENIGLMKGVKSFLEESGIRTYMVEAGLGQDFGEMTRFGLTGAKVMVAFCTDNYGEYTGRGFETYYELDYFQKHQQEMTLFPVKLGYNYPPNPPGDRRGIDLTHTALSLTAIFLDGCISSGGTLYPKAPLEIGVEIHKALEKTGLLQDVTK